MKKIKYLDKEERDLIESIEKGKLKRMPKKQEESLKNKLQQAAGEYRLNKQKNSRVNMRIPDSDLILVRKKAAIQGLPYQTLICSIIHQYVMGNLKSVN